MKIPKKLPIKLSKTKFARSFEFARSVRAWLGRASVATSLRSRIVALFALVLAITLAFGLLVLLQYHRMAIQGSTRTVREYAVIEKLSAIRDIVETLHHDYQLRDYLLRESGAQNSGKRVGAEYDPGKAVAGSIEAAEKKIQELRVLPDSELADLASLVAERFRVYQVYLNEKDAAAKEAIAFRDLQAAIVAALDLQKLALYRSAHALRQEYEVALKNGIFFLIAFIIFLGFAVLRSIRLLTGPLTELSRVLDSVSLDAELPVSLPALQVTSPEVERVTHSFERLMLRLRGYRAFNFRRLLAEKRRRDIVAKSVLDGIFLLHGDELTYVNPIGEAMLGLSHSISWKGLRVSQPELQASQQSSDEVSSSYRILRAISGVITKTIPVELDVVMPDQRKLVFLLQSIPISEEVIEQVETEFLATSEKVSEGFLDEWRANTLVIARDITIMRESQEAKSHFLATLSHEVKTPVTSLTMAIRLLKKAVDQFPNAMHRKLIETSAEDVERLRRLLDDFLNVSALDSLTQRLELRRVDLAKLIKKSTQHFQPQAFERGISLGFEVLEARDPVSSFEAGRDVPVQVELDLDAAKISWAVSNMLTNALRHTPRGGIVGVRLAVGTKEVVVRIIDSGPGIEPNRRDRVFDRLTSFYDLRVARTGTLGMGLAIAREIITAHGGKIWIKSELGQGSEFCFSLPLPERQAEIISKGENRGSNSRSG